MMYNKKNVNGLGVLSGYAKYLPLLALIAVLAALAVSSFCTHTPEYCGEGQELKPGMFCFDNKAWTKCGGDEYNPYSQFCTAGAIYEKCNGKDGYDPAREFCSGNTVVPKCGGLEYDPSRQTCDGTTIVDRHPEIPRPKYTVYFNANGATGAPPEIVSSDSGSVILLPDQVGMVKDKHSFAGWNTEADGSGENYNVYGKYTVTRNVALFAQWTRNPYTLTVNVSPPNGGTVSRNPNKETYVHGEQITVTATPASGNAFKGWSGASSSKNNTITIIMDDDKTLTAGFGAPDAKQFTVYFNGNGTTGGSAPATISVDSGSNITLPGQQTMEKIGGYVFDGWTANSSGTGTGYAANASYTVTKDVTLYAKWIRFYTVTFNGNGTTVGVPEAVKADSGTLITLSAITRNGYKFDGWNTNSSGTGTNYATNFSYIVTGNVTLYAKWIPIYTVTYNGNGTTTNVPQAVNADSGTSITLSNQGNMARTGYRFGWWSTNSAGTGTSFREDSAYTVTGNVTLYARWVPVYTVTYNGNGTNMGVPETVMVDSGIVITLPGQGNMVRAKYNFDGWGKNSSGGTSYPAGSSYTVTNNTTLYASWIATYTLTVNVLPSGTGTVSFNPIGGNYIAGTSVTIAATPASGYTFAKWLLGTGVATGTTNSVTIITMNGDRTLTANFYQPGTFTDTRNNKTYKTVKIGNQTWMAENLNYDDNDTSTSFGTSFSSSLCYNNSADSCAKYGRLYRCMARKTVCPTGWKLPDTADWNRLAETAGGKEIAGKKLKSVSGWYDVTSSYKISTDEYGFSALPGGHILPVGYLKSGSVGITGWWWTATEDDSGRAYIMTMYYDYDTANMGRVSDGNDYYHPSAYANIYSSVRCVQDNVR